MNEVMLGKSSPPAGLASLGRLVWSAAGPLLLTGLYTGRIQRSWLRFEQLDMPLPHLGSAFEGLRLVLLADLHCSPLVLDSYLRQCVRHVNDLRPDFIVLAGDLVTGPTRYVEKFARLAEEFRPRLATLACLGNHDYGIFDPVGRGYMRNLAGQIERRLEQAGVTVLRNRSTVLRRRGQSLQFIGAEDIWSPFYNPWAAFAQADTRLPTICLSHNPDSALDLLALGAHWVLSGHTHGNGPGELGVVEALAPQAHKDFVAGHYRLGPGHLYVNRGLSYARRHVANARPEITVFTLRQAWAHSTVDYAGHGELLCV